MDRKLHVWKVSLVGDNSTTAEVEFASYMSPAWPGARESAMRDAAATASVAAKRRVIYTGVSAELVDDAAPAPEAAPAEA